MGEKTGIAWTDHTFNPWWGCVKISPACTNCYAADLDARFKGDHWGPRSSRKTFGDKHWNEPRKWQRAAQAAGVRRRVFCASMADWAEDLPELVPLRERLWSLIWDTPDLDWLLLTKRHENIARLVPWSGTDTPWRNVWLGVTVENQEYADERIPALLSVDATVHFLSMEPLLGPVDIEPWLARECPETGNDLASLNWVIAGCESTDIGRRRDTEVDWYRQIRDACAATRTAFFLKQARPALETRPPTRGFLPVIQEGAGSWTKNDGTIELPYLDGNQHAAFPAPRFATHRNLF
jgi:protein gp37